MLLNAFKIYINTLAISHDDGSTEAITLSR